MTRHGNLRSGIHGVGAFQTASGTVRPGDWNSVVVSGLDLIDPPAEGGFSLTFVVNSVPQGSAANGFFLGVVGDNSVFYRDGSTWNFGLTFFGTESRTNSGGGFGLNFGDNFGSVGAELRLADADIASFQDGFSATIRADQLGWSYEMTGLSIPEGSPNSLLHVWYVERGRDNFRDVLWHRPELARRDQQSDRCR